MPSGLPDSTGPLGRLPQPAGRPAPQQAPQQSPQQSPQQREPAGGVLGRSFFDRPAEEVAPDLLGQVIEHDTPHGTVAIRLTEVEAYAGTADPASHAYRGPSRRNAVMFGPAGYVYVYFTYGMHYCMNLVCLPEGPGSAVLLRAGRVVQGAALARGTRARLPGRLLASGPARLCTALAVGREHNGADVCHPAAPLRARTGEPAPRRAIRSGPRTGVAAAADVPWRFWIAGDDTVSPYRPHVPRKRSAAGPVRSRPAG